MVCLMSQQIKYSQKYIKNYLSLEVVISLCGQLVIIHVKTNMLDGWMIAIY